MPQLTKFLIGSVASALIFTTVGPARADPPPELYALMTCDVKHGHFSLKTLVSNSPYDNSVQASADPKVTTRISLSGKAVHACRLPGYTVDVRTDFRGGTDHGECAVWDKGGFHVRVNGAEVTYLPAPQCSQTERHDLDMQVTAGRGLPSVWTTDCVLDSDYQHTFDAVFACRLVKIP